MKTHNELVVEAVYKRENLCAQGFCQGRMNLTAVSSMDRETLFVAVDDVIFVYSLSQFEELDENKSTREPKEPIRKLQRDWSDSESHTINAIKVGMMGQEEVLVCVDDSGGVGLWYTADLNRRSILLSNEESTWGIALQGPKRLLAVSSNSHNITIYNLKSNMDLSEDVNDRKVSPGSSASTVLRRFLDVVDRGDVPQYLLVGHSHNIPNISFSPCGNFLVSCSIDSSCRIWNVQTGETMISRDVSRQWGWSACFVSTSTIKVAPESSSAWNRPLYRTDLNRTNQLRDQTRQFPVGLDDNGDSSDVGTVNTTALVHGVSNVRFDHSETEFEDGYLDTTGDDAVYSSGHESDPDGDRESDSENEIGSLVDLDNGSGNDSHTPMPESMSDEEWESTPEPESHHTINDDDGNERNETDFSPMSRPSAPDVHRHIERNSFDPSIPFSYNWTSWSSNSPPYSPASPQYHSQRLGMPLRDPTSHHSALQSSTDSAPSQPPPALHSDYSNYSRENSHPSLTVQSHPAISVVREQLHSTPQYTPQYSPLLSPNSLLHPSHTPTFSDPLPTSPNFTIQSLHSTSSSMYREIPENSTIGGTSESMYTTMSQYDDSPTSPNHGSSGSREPSSPHSQRNPDRVINSPVYSPLSPTESLSSPQLIERRRRVHILQPRMSSRLRRISNFRGSEVSDDEATSGPVHRTIDHLPAIQPTNSGSLNANLRESKRLQQTKPHARELVLFSTQYDLYLLDPKSGLRALDFKRGVARDSRRGFVLASHDRLNMVEYIPELSLAIVASQKGKIALVRILKKYNSAGEENYFLYHEKYLPLDPLPTTPLLGMFVVKNFIKGLAPKSCFCRLYLTYMSGEFYCYDIRRSEQSNDLIGLDKILL